jgi:hypothetical protein
LAGGRVGDRIGGVDHGFAGEVRRARGFQRVKRHRTFDRQHHDFAELRGVGKAAGLCSLVLGDKVLELCGIARAERDLVAMLEKTAGERFGHVAGSQNADFHARPSVRYIPRLT